MAVFSRPVTIPTTCIETYATVYLVSKNCHISSSCHFAFMLVHVKLANNCIGSDLKDTSFQFTLLMRRKKLTKRVLRETALGILQSTIFLTTHSVGFPFVICTLRRWTGRFTKYSVSFWPAFLSSVVAIHLERASRRPILCLYVTNVATETLFRMAVWRGWVKPIKYGETIIFTLSTAFLLYLFRSDATMKDSMFSALRYIVGPYEEAKSPEKPLLAVSPPPSRSKKVHSAGEENYSMYVVISNICQAYSRFINSIRSQPRSPFCPHPHSCLSYSLQGFGNGLGIGCGIQLVLRLVLSGKKLLRKPSLFPKIIFGHGFHNLGMFLGLFCLLFRGSSCSLRWFQGSDSELHSIPAGLLAGLSFLFYPDTTAALYVMWKALQILYSKMVQAGYLPDIPHGTVFLYCLSTAILFHAAILEPQNLRPSYYKFMHLLSGGRIAMMSRDCLDPFGMETSKYHANVMKQLRLDFKLVQHYLVDKWRSR
ncbi:hypothetical protein RUM43_003512 [Polyplax serrata]|uniref:Transmembrane protein 135 N-terminal domain-containing protein n=1 Tax=Polyplax serrata TaxID=468196 RepID=A0AAN8S6I6_POLSC